MNILADPTAIAAFLAVTSIGTAIAVVRWYLGRNEKRHEGHEGKLANLDKDKVGRDELQGMVDRLSGDTRRVADAVLEASNRVDQLHTETQRFHLEIVKEVAAIAARREGGG